LRRVDDVERDLCLKEGRWPDP